MLPPASPGKERARSGSLKSFEFQLPLSSLPPRGAPLQSRSDDLRSPGSGRSFTSTESEPAQSAPPSTPRPRSQSLTVMAIQNKKAAVPRSSLALPISALNLPRTQSSPRAAPQLGPGFSPRNQSPRSGNQSPRLIGSPRNSSPRSQPKGEKRFPCPVPLCDAGYARRTVLLRHFSAKHGHLINLYPEMKPDDISCPVPGCNASFLRKGNLIHHYRRFHPEQTYQQHFSFRWIVENDAGENGTEMDYGEDYGDDLMMLDDMDAQHGPNFNSNFTSEFSAQFRNYSIDEASLLSLPYEPALISPRNSNTSMEERYQLQSNDIHGVSMNYELQDIMTLSSSPRHSLAPGYPQKFIQRGHHQAQQHSPSPNLTAGSPTSTMNPSSFSPQTFQPTSILIPPMHNIVSENTVYPFSPPITFASDYISPQTHSNSNSDENLFFSLRPMDDVAVRIPSDESLNLTSHMDYSMQ